MDPNQTPDLAAAADAGAAAVAVATAIAERLPNGETGRALVAPAGLALLGGAARLAMSRKNLTLPEVARGMTIAAFAGMVVNILAQNFGIDEAVRPAVVGVAAYAADDLLVGLGVIAARIARDPGAFVVDLLARRVPTAVTTPEKPAEPAPAPAAPRPSPPPAA